MLFITVGLSWQSAASVSPLTAPSCSQLLRAHRARSQDACVAGLAHAEARAGRGGGQGHDLEVEWRQCEGVGVGVRPLRLLSLPVLINIPVLFLFYYKVLKMTFDGGEADNCKTKESKTTEQIRARRHSKSTQHAWRRQGVPSCCTLARTRPFAARRKREGEVPECWVRAKKRNCGGGG